MIVTRGYKTPPPLYSDTLRSAQVGYFFNVMTQGYGIMPSYAAQVSVADRWAITAYIRALQLSQNARLADRRRRPRRPSPATWRSRLPAAGSRRAPPNPRARSHEQQPQQRPHGEKHRRRDVRRAGDGRAPAALRPDARRRRPGRRHRRLLHEPDPSFFRSYLVGWVYCVGIAFGSLALAMMQHLTGGGWGVLVRRQMEAATRTIPVLLLAAVPLFFWLPRLYSWADPAKVRVDPVLRWKTHSYLTSSGYIGRLVLYFAIAWVLAHLLNRMSLEQDRTADAGLAKRMRMVSGPGDRHLLPGRDVRVGGLADVARAALGLDHVRLLPHHQPGAVGPTFTIVMVFFSPRSEPRRRWCARSTSTTTASSTRADHDVDLHLLLAVPDHLGGQPAGGDLLVPAPHPLGLGRGGGDRRLVPFRAALRPPPVARLQAAAEVVGAARRLDAADAWWTCSGRWSLHVYAAGSQRPEMEWMYLAVPAALFGGWLWLYGYQLKRRPLLPLNDPQIGEVVRT